MEQEKRQKERAQLVKILSVYTLLYGCCFVMAWRDYYIPASATLVLAGAVIYYIRVRDAQTLVDLPGLLSLSWLGGQGLACLKLSNIQTEWQKKTWICFFLLYICFWAGYYYSSILYENRKKRAVSKIPKQIQAKRILNGIVAITILSAGSFALEAVLLGFVPIFSKEGHAYLAFHISGIHYFTVHSVMVMPLTVLYFKWGAKSKRIKTILSLCNFTAVMIPILCVSRFHLIFMIGMTGVVYLLLYQKGSIKLLGILSILLVILYVLLSLSRNQDASYLNQVFDMKNRQTPVWISQPYMYITSNYDNFNYMVQEMTRHAYDGVRMLYPFFALTGLKFIFPVEISRPPYIVKEELSTFTMFYDAYYDFGIIGLCIFAVLLGLAAAVLTILCRRQQNIVINLFYGQIAVYFALSFFTTWFSDPAVWFRLIFTGVLSCYVGHYKGKTEKTYDNRCSDTGVLSG